ncbi:hypothetical protein DdX_16145 [Ditylenchus destructor]|uniref:Uncharacterized protein n=1 Tax=Ditylenchus destructor TaxID=166010 RepID=A0AAD4R0C4_9BILA|nr:hypothetical protein DdX_16145 [Ditylenchus destructor]
MGCAAGMGPIRSRIPAWFDCAANDCVNKIHRVGQMLVLSCKDTHSWLASHRRVSFLTTSLSSGYRKMIQIDRFWSLLIPEASVRNHPVHFVGVRRHFENNNNDKIDLESH